MSFIHCVVYANSTFVIVLFVCVCMCVWDLFSHVRLFATPWTEAHQTPLSVEFFRQKYWSGLPFPFPRDLSDPGIEPGSPTLQADSLPSEPPEKPNHIVITIFFALSYTIIFAILLQFFLFNHGYCFQSCTVLNNTWLPQGQTFYILI